MERVRRVGDEGKERERKEEKEQRLGISGTRQTVLFYVFSFNLYNGSSGDEGWLCDAMRRKFIRLSNTVQEEEM